jgi:hypothetical protein
MRCPKTPSPAETLRPGSSRMCSRKQPEAAVCQRLWTRRGRDLGTSPQVRSGKSEARTAPRHPARHESSTSWATDGRPARRHRYTVLGVAMDSPWLFPGTFAGQPLSSHHPGTRLKQMGIQPRPGRASALMGISSQLPAAILTELLAPAPRPPRTQTGG